MGYHMQPMGKRANRLTRADVARAAKVSVATVSYVLNGTKCVSPEVRERVLRVAKELNYTPNRIAQSLAGSRTNSVAVVTEDLGNLYHLEVIKGLQSEALNRDFIVYIFDASDGVDRYVHPIVSRGVDGVFVIASERIVPDRFLQEIRDAGISVLADCSRVTRVTGVSYIGYDLCGGARALASHLFGLGHRCFGYVGGEKESAVRDVFLKEAASVWNRSDFPVFAEDAGLSSASEQGERLATALLKGRQGITAVICPNEATAMGVADAARELGLDIPKDLSVASLENPGKEASFPGLTSLSNSGREYGAGVFNALYGDIEKERTAEYVLPVRLIARRSTAPPKERE